MESSRSEEKVEGHTGRVVNPSEREKIRNMYPGVGYWKSRS